MTTLKLRLEYHFHNFLLASILTIDRLRRFFRRSQPRSFWDL